MSLELAYVEERVPSNFYGAAGAGVFRTKINELDAAIRSLMLDVQARTGTIADAGEGGVGFIRNFAAFEGEWRLWIDAHNHIVELAISQFTVADELANFIRRYNIFERQYRTLTGQAPSNPGVDEPRPGGSYAPLIWGTLGVVALFGLAWLLREGRGVAREARGFFPSRSEVDSDDLGPLPPRGFRGLRPSRKLRR